MISPFFVGSVDELEPSCFLDAESLSTLFMDSDNK